MLGARPDLDPPHRGDDRRAPRRGHRRDRHPQHAAGPAGVRPLRLLPRRGERARPRRRAGPDRQDVRATPTTRGRSTTSTVGSDERSSAALRACCGPSPSRSRSWPWPSSARATSPRPARQRRRRSTAPARPTSALAMQQWIAEGQTLGLRVNYTPTGSPDGLSRYAGGQVDFAGTEAEFASLGVQAGGATRGYQYVPDVAGAIAVMYNVEDVAGRKVDYLHLSRSTIARIFIGEITHWDDAGDRGRQHAGQPPAARRADQRRVPLRRVRHHGALLRLRRATSSPALFAGWAARNRLPTQRAHHRARQRTGLRPEDPGAVQRPTRSPSTSPAAPASGRSPTTSSATPRSTTSTRPGSQNEQGKWVLPYAENISAALDSATLRPDLSQELSGRLRAARTRWPTRSRPTATWSPSAGSPATGPRARGPYAERGRGR